MANWKTAALTVALVAGLLALLFGTGLVKVSKSDADEDEDAESGEDEDEGDEAGKKGKRKGKKRKGKKKKKKSGDLDSLGYIGATEIREEDRGKVGVTKHDKDAAAGGLNLFNPCAWGKKYRRAAGGKILREAQLIDMDGKVLHQWQTTYADDTTRGWAMAKLGDDGFLYAVNARTGFVKLDWDSKLIWGVRGGYHHDFDFGPDGSVWSLYEKRRTIKHNDKDVVILDNGFAVISQAGEQVKEMSFYDQLKDDPHFVAILDKRVNRRGARKNAVSEDDDEPTPKKTRAIDIFHSNTLEFLDSASKGNWEAGDVITSMRELDLIAVFDAKSMKLKWQWGKGELDRPHDPTMLSNGHVLIFDNGMHRKHSRVIEIDPLADNNETWSYRGTDADPFFSSMRGLVQHMPNDNVLITSSQQGRVFEVNRKGEVVWEFWGTYVLGGSLRVPIRLIRLEGKALEFAKKKLAEAG